MMSIAEQSKKIAELRLHLAERLLQEALHKGLMRELKLTYARFELYFLKEELARYENSFENYKYGEHM